MKIWRLLIQAVGGATILLSALGFFSLIYMLPRGLAPLSPDLALEAPYYRTAFVVMNTIAAAFLLAMILIAVGLLKPSRLAVRAYTGISVCLLIYPSAMGFLWRPGPVGASIATASGVGNIGLGLLIFYPVKYLYLIMTVILANLAIWRLKKEPAANLPHPAH